MKDEIKIGVIGAGLRSSLADYAHKPESGTTLVAAADPDKNALDAFKKKYGSDVFVTHDYRELLNKYLDAVFITSPDHLHEEQAIASLKAGKHVFLEKPMAITIEGCDKILKTVLETKSKLYVGHNMRHMTVIRKMKAIVDSGKIGEVKAAWCRHFISYGGDAYFKDWHAERAKSTGLLLQKGAHDIDVMHWLCGSSSKKVVGLGGLTLYDEVKDKHAPDVKVPIVNTHCWPPLAQKDMHPIIDVEDLSMIMMELHNGVFASYQQCHYTPDAWRNYTIIGTEGRVENFGDEPGKCVIRVWDRLTEYNPYGDEQYYIPPEDGTHGGADPKIVAEFLEFIKGKKLPVISPVAARNAVAAGYMATKSLRNGNQSLVVPDVSEEIVGYFEKELAAV